MYSLYYDKEKGIIKVKKTSKILQNVEHKEEVTYYNSCYYLCLYRKPLVELARQMRDEWVEEYEGKINDLKSLKI